MKLPIDLFQFKDQLQFKISEKGKKLIFDPIRKKHMVLLPEELVRQLLIHFFLYEMHISRNKIQVEKSVNVNKVNRRYDMILYDGDYKPVLLVECKSFKIKLKEETFRQLASYNFDLKVPFLMITNGLENYLCKMNYTDKNYEFLNHFPDLK